MPHSLSNFRFLHARIPVAARVPETNREPSWWLALVAQQERSLHPLNLHHGVKLFRKEFLEIFLLPWRRMHDSYHAFDHSDLDLKQQLSGGLD